MNNMISLGKNIQSASDELQRIEIIDLYNMLLSTYYTPASPKKLPKNAAKTSCGKTKFKAKRKPRSHNGFGVLNNL